MLSMLMRKHTSNLSVVIFSGDHQPKPDQPQQRETFLVKNPKLIYHATLYHHSSLSPVTSHYPICHIYMFIIYKVYIHICMSYDTVVAFYILHLCTIFVCMDGCRMPSSNATFRIILVCASRIDSYDIFYTFFTHMKTLNFNNRQVMCNNLNMVKYFYVCICSLY